MQHAERRLHMLYICGILTLIIVGFVSYIAVESDPQGSVLMSYISFASTLTSIILSVLAIIYTMISNSKGDSYITKLDQTSVSIDKSSSNLSEMSARIEETLKNLAELPRKINDSSKYLKEELDKKLGEFQNVVDETKQEVRMTRAEILEGLNASNPSNPPSDTTYLRNIIQPFLSSGSFLGLLGLLACVLTKETGKTTFQFEDIFEEKAYAEYLRGYLIASSALGLFSVDIASFGEVTIQEVHKELTKDILLEYLKKSNYAQSNQTESEEYIERVLKFFQAT